MSREAISTPAAVKKNKTNKSEPGVIFLLCIAYEVHLFLERECGEKDI